MNKGKIIAWLCLIAMTFGLANGFINGNFFQDGGKLLSNPWGIMSLIDLYVGFVIFAMWIVFREKNMSRATIWILFLMILGFFTASLYLIKVFKDSNGNWLDFFLGERKSDIMKVEGTTWD